MMKALPCEVRDEKHAYREGYQEFSCELHPHHWDLWRVVRLQIIVVPERFRHACGPSLAHPRTFHQWCYDDIRVLR